jgi:hypothetical protein
MRPSRLVDHAVDHASSSWSAAVIRIAAAAVGAASGRHRIAAQPADDRVGRVLERQDFVAHADRGAPPDPPSPMTTTIGPGPSSA